MKLFLLFVLSVLLLGVHTAPTRKHLIASTKDLGATLVRVPTVRQGCDRQIKEKGKGKKDKMDKAKDDDDEEVKNKDVEDEDVEDEDVEDEDVEDEDVEDEEPVTFPPSTTPTSATTFTTATTVAPPTLATTTMASTTSTETSTGAAGPPADTGRCVSCAMKNFDIVNQYRTSKGLSTLGWNEELAGLAEQWSKTMFDTKVFEHSDFNYWENIIWGYGNYNWDNVAEEFFDGWKNSEGHDENMRVETHQCMGVGIYGDGYTFYGTQIFSSDCP